MRSLSILCLFVALSGGRPSCKQPLQAFCDMTPCRSLDQILATSSGVSDGGCPGFALSECGPFRVVGSSGRVGTALYFDPDGGLVGVSQATDVVWDCGSAEQTFGEVPSCAITNTTSRCAN